MLNTVIWNGISGNCKYVRYTNPLTLCTDWLSIPPFVGRGGHYHLCAGLRGSVTGLCVEYLETRDVC